MRIKIVSVLAAFFFCTLPCKAQEMDLGVAVGLSIYDGEVTPVEILDYFQMLRPSAGVFARLHFSDHLAARAQFTYAKLYGDDAIAERPRDFNFENDLFEFYLMGEWSLFKVHFTRNVTYAMPYIHGGVALNRSNPRTFFEGQWITLRELGTEAQGAPGYPDPYPVLNFALPIGGGVKLVINRSWTIFGEVTGRYSLTDHLDDISDARFVYRDVLENNGELAARISWPLIDPETGNLDQTIFRGGPFTDVYYTFHLGVSFYLNSSGGGRGGVRCYEF